MARKITALKIQKKNPQRVNIYLDGEFGFGLSKIVAAWLHVGQELDEQKINDLLEKDQHEVAYQKALKYIGYRERTEHELHTYLSKLEFPDEEIEAVMERLAQADLVNDQRFARMWVENRNEFRPRSQRALIVELRQHGISNAAIQAALDGTSEEENAYRAARKQSQKYSGLEWNEFRNKIYAYLARKGFDYEVISPTIHRVWEENTNMNPNNSINEANP
jgi:regulatory protein